jgi:hypothetical protein
VYLLAFSVNPIQLDGHISWDGIVLRPGDAQIVEFRTFVEFFPVPATPSHSDLIFTATPSQFSLIFTPSATPSQSGLTFTATTWQFPTPHQPPQYYVMETLFLGNAMKTMARHILFRNLLDVTNASPSYFDWHRFPLTFWAPDQLPKQTQGSFRVDEAS